MKMSQSSMPMKPKKGGGSAKMSQDPNGTQTMPKGKKVDPYVAWKGDGGAKNGRNAGKGC